MDEAAKLEGLDGVGGQGAAANQDDEVWGQKAADDVMDIEGGADSLPDEATLTFPGPIAQTFYFDDGDVVGIQGPVGSGKTTTLLRSRLRRARTAPRSTQDRIRRYKLLVVRETYRELWSTTIPSYLEVFPKSLGEWSGGRGDPVTHKIKFSDEFGEIEMITEFMAFGDDVVASMRGIQVTDIWLNEADTMNVLVLVSAITRIDRYPAKEHLGPSPEFPNGYPPEHRSYGQVVCDFNAPDEENWTYDVFHDEEKRKETAAMLAVEAEDGARAIAINFHRQPGYGEAGAENMDNLSPTYYPRQIAAMKLAGRGDMIERLVYNRIVYLKVGDPVFSREFNRRIHVMPEGTPIPSGLRLRLGLDQGLLGAAVALSFEPPYFWTVWGEMMFPKERLQAADFGRRLSDWLDETFPGATIEGAYGDLAGEKTASEAVEETENWNKIVSDESGIKIRPQRIGGNRIQPRLEAVRAGLEYLEGGRPGVVIHPSCKFMRRGFEARYVYAEEIGPDGDRRKVPNKRFFEANVMDALQYGMLSEARPDGTTPISAGRRNNPQQRRKARRHGAPDTRKRLTATHDVSNPYGG